MGQCRSPDRVPKFTEHASQHSQLREQHRNSTRRDTKEPVQALNHGPVHKTAVGAQREQQSAGDGGEPDAATIYQVPGGRLLKRLSALKQDNIYDGAVDDTLPTI